MQYYDNSSSFEMVYANHTPLHSFDIDANVYNSIGASVVVLFIFALTEHIAILIVFRRSPKLHTHANYWIMSLIVCDILIVLNAFPLLSASCFAKEFILGEAGCLWDGFIVTCLGCSSICILTGLSIQRYCIMIKDGYVKQHTKSRTLIYISLCFLFGTFWGVMPLLGFGTFVPEGIGVSCAPDWRSKRGLDWIYTGTMFVFVLFIPTLVMSFCYCSILVKVWKAKVYNTSWFQQRRVKRDIKVTFSVALTIVSFLVSWMPYSVVNLAGTFFDFDAYRIHPMLVQMPCLIAKTACVWNPIVYVCTNGDFREAVRRSFRTLWKLPNNDTFTVHVHGVPPIGENET